MRSVRLATLLRSVRMRGRANYVGAGVAVLALALTTVPAGAGVAAASSGRSTRAPGLTAAQPAPQDDPTASQDNLRTGWDPNEPGLSPSVVHGASFGQVFRTAVNGQVYAQPLVIGSTLIVATENDWVYGLNASTGAIIWSTSLGTPYAIKTCNNVAPNIGVTSTPVYDPSSGTAYVMAQVVSGTSVAWRLYGINITTGALTFQRGIYGSPSNDSHITFSTAQQGQRAGLLLLNGWVYAAFASHCDHQPYAGYVAAVDLANKASSTLWTDEAGVTNNQAGIWQSSGGLVSDGPGRIFLTSGNGVSPAAGPGGTPPAQLAESVVRLAPQADGTLAAQDFFSPANAPTLDANDLDYGAAGPAELPVGTTAYPHVLVQGGKVGRIFLLNADNLGGRDQGPGGSDENLYQSQPYGGLWGHPAVFEASTSPIPAGSSGLSDYVYSVGKNDYVRAFQIGTDSSGTPQLADVANSTFQFGYGSGSPVVTSNGNDPLSAVVWVVDKSGSSSSLIAFPVVPQPAKGGGVKLQQIDGEPIGTASNFTVPATSNGMVYVGTLDGHVLGFGVTTAAALQRAGTGEFGTTAVGSATTRTATVTASRTVTVTGINSSAITSPDPFTIGQVTKTSPSGPPVPVTFPVTLNSGDALHARVTFAPAAPGGTSGAVSFATTAGQNVPVSVPLIADATQTGLYATAPSLSMLLSLNDGTQVGPVPVGLPEYAVSTIVNGGTTPQRITKISGPGGPFSARFVPPPGTVLQPGQSVTVQFAYTPSQAVSSTSALTITGSSGTPAKVSLSGASAPAVSKFSAPQSVSFGNVPVGHKATRFIHIVNAGNQAALVRSTALAGPFHAPDRVAPGLPVNGGYDLSIPVTFTPAATGYTIGAYTFSWTDRFGPHSLTIPINGTGV